MSITRSALRWRMCSDAIGVTLRLEPIVDVRSLLKFLAPFTTIYLFCSLFKAIRSSLRTHFSKACFLSWSCRLVTSKVSASIFDSSKRSSRSYDSKSICSRLCYLSVSSSMSSIFKFDIFVGGAAFVLSFVCCFRFSASSKYCCRRVLGKVLYQMSL